MMADSSRTGDDEVRAAVETALRLVCVTLPHLAGLAHSVRVSLDRRVGTAGVFASGHIVVNPDWFATLERGGDAAFVLAHELLHLALQSHRRTAEEDPLLVNVAHDYVINDMLVEALGRPAPMGGLTLPGARHRSLESVVQEIKDAVIPPSSWSAAGDAPPETALSDALRKAGLLPPQTEQAAPETDVLSDDQEREWFPSLSPRELERARRSIQELAARAVSLEALHERLERLDPAHLPGEDEGDWEIVARALRTLYRPPWELALQRWMEAVTPGPRSYARPSRRAGDRADVVLAGRKRDGWTLHIVLDTSGSMIDEFGRILGAIAAFCESVAVDRVRVLQCDVEVTRDDVLAPADLEHVVIAGLGGSDLTPAMLRLAEDAEVEAVIVVTDGYVDIPRAPMPYAVLWTLTGTCEDFDPPYGQVLVVEE